jgi:hypothetical protein
LTPETEIDKEIDKILSSLVNMKTTWYWMETTEITPITCKIMKGSFYSCQWGWTRQWKDADSIIFQF